MTYKLLIIAALATFIFFNCAEDNAEKSQGGVDNTIFVKHSTSNEESHPGLKINDILGTTVHTCWDDSAGCQDAMEFEFTKLEEVGVKTIRHDFTWSEIEPEDDNYNLSGPQKLADAAKEHGIEVIALLDYCNSWACEDDNTSTIDVEKFAQYAGKIAKTLKDELTYYEVWNEENLAPRFWKPATDPAKYGELLKAAYTAIKQNDPDAKVLFGGLAPLYTRSMYPDPHGIWGFYYQVKYYHPDIDNYFDIFSIHPYTAGQFLPPDFELPLQKIIAPTIGKAIQYAQEMTNKPVWITEFGWPSFYMSEDIQAAYLARGFIIAAHQRAERALWYTFWDSTGNTTEDRFGLFHPDRTEKPSYLALKTLHELLGELRPLENAADHLKLQPWEVAYLFIDDQDNPKALAIWSVAPGSQRSAKIKIPFSDGPYKIYDMTGDLEKSTNDKGEEIEINISDYPIYILW